MQHIKAYGFNSPAQTHCAVLVYFDLSEGIYICIKFSELIRNLVFAQALCMIITKKVVGIKLNKNKQ